MGSNWWLKFAFVVVLVLLAVRALVPTFYYLKPEFMPAFKVQYKVDKKGKLVLDKNGKAIVLYEKYKSGKKKGKVVKDKNNRPIPIFARNSEGWCIPEMEYKKVYEYEVVIDPKTKKPKLDPKTKKTILKLDKLGKPIVKRDSNGLPVVKRDKVGRVVYAKDAQGKPILLRDKKNRPIKKYVKVPVIDTEGKVVKKNGVVVMKKEYMTDEVWERCYLPSWYRRFFPYKKILRLGLDLQGGTHLVLRVDVDKAIQNKASRLADDLTAFLLEKKMIKKKTDVFHDPDKSQIEVTVGTKDITKFRNAVEKAWGYVKTYSTSKTNVYLVRFTKTYLQKSKESAISQAIETIRGRVDALGVSEPSITKYGQSQIVIQLPGLKDPRRAKELIGKTALLAFHIVEDDSPDASKIFSEMKKSKPLGVTALVTSYTRPKGAAPGTDRLFWGENKRVLQHWLAKWNRKLARSYGRKYRIYLGTYDIGGKNKETHFWRTYLLWRKASLTGEGLEEARPQLDPEMNRPEVGLNFNRKGADIFEKMTGAHVGHRFAIVLEGKVDSAPVIQTRIGGGKARITLGGMKSYEESLQDSKDLAFILKSGSLPAPVDILYEKTVGPGLGADSIRRGVLSLIIGFILVILFIAVYYRGSGLNANLALFLNILFVMGIMAGFGASLTLPGMAGILLTIGMAVDANILIFERIREELRSGKVARVAVQNGYEKALTTILDANITTSIAGIVLYQYGSGPIRGFAVTLLIGIICSVFTALFVTRLVFEFFLRRKTSKQLSI